MKKILAVTLAVILLFLFLLRQLRRPPRCLSKQGRERFVLGRLYGRWRRYGICNGYGSKCSSRCYQKEKINNFQKNARIPGNFLCTFCE